MEISEVRPLDCDLECRLYQVRVPSRRTDWKHKIQYVIGTKRTYRVVAEGAGFEPARQLITVYTLSRHAPSTARPPLRGTCDRPHAAPGQTSEPIRCTQQTGRAGGSEHSQRGPVFWRRESTVECRQIVLGQHDIEGAAVFTHMVGARGFRDHDRAVLPEQPSQRDLRRRRLPATGDLG